MKCTNPLRCLSLQHWSCSFLMTKSRNVEKKKVGMTKKLCLELVPGPQVGPFFFFLLTFQSTSKVASSACPLSPRRHSNFLYALLLHREEEVALVDSFSKAHNQWIRLVQCRNRFYCLDDLKIVEGNEHCLCGARDGCCDSCAFSPQGDVLAQPSLVLSVSQTQRQVGNEGLNHGGI